MKKTTFLFSLLTFLSVVQVFAQQSVATYDISFTSTWNSTDHGTLPANAHWSDLVGANHNSNITFLEMGQPASPGIEDVAELGVNTDFNTEVQTEINNGNAQQWLQSGFSPFAAISTASLNAIEISSDYPLLTLASMIAPSPDWMIAVNSLNLIDENTNTWKPSIVVDLFPYDAGTEEGFGYSINNDPTIGGVITNIAGAPGYPFNTNKVGTLTITLRSVLSVDDQEQQTSKVDIYPNPAKDNITIRSSIAIKTIDVYSILGKKVKQYQFDSNITEQSLDLSSLQSGMYMIRFETNNGSILTKKLALK